MTKTTLRSDGQSHGNCCRRCCTGSGNRCRRLMTSPAPGGSGRVALFGGPTGLADHVRRSAALRCPPRG
eukprot:1428602-Lingulodinium_polyedra.AAC.1